MGKRATPGAPRKKSAPLGRSSFRSFSWGFFSPCIFDGSEQNRNFFRHILKSEPPGATRKKSAPRVALYSVHFRGVFAMEMAFFDLGIKSDPEKCDLRKKSDP